MKSDDDKKPEIPPMPTPERGAQIEVPPPPMGYGPQDRRVVAVTPPPPTISDVTKHGPSASELLAQARQASRQEEYDTVQRLASQLLAKKPNDLDALLLLARAQLAAGKISPARTTSERVLTLHPNTAEAHAILGKIHLDKGRTRDAKVEYEHALKLDPACALARAGLARILILGTAQN
jgi:cytochrome c-type biogenesis protein CcmH/NrfG